VIRATTESKTGNLGKFILACVAIGAVLWLTRDILEGVTGYEADFELGIAAGFMMWKLGVWK